MSKQITEELRLFIEQQNELNSKFYRYSFRDANFEDGKFVFVSGHPDEKLLKPIFNELHEEIIERIKADYRGKILNLRDQLQRFEEALEKAPIVRNIEQ